MKKGTIITLITAGGALWAASLTYGLMYDFDVPFLIGEGVGIILAFTGLFADASRQRNLRTLIAQRDNLLRIQNKKAVPESNDDQETFEQKVMLERGIQRINNEIGRLR